MVHKVSKQAALAKVAVMRTHLVMIASLALAATSCGETSDADLSLKVTWSFLSGDCTSNMVQTVRVGWGPAGGEQQSVDFDCALGQGKLGDLPATGGSYGITAKGLDATGAPRFTHFGTTLNVTSGGTFGRPVDLTLRPNPADVIVNWSLSNGSGCPNQVVLPYFIALYKPPATMGGALTEKVQETQESCTSRTATLQDVTPGDYVVELDSRAVTPKVRGTKAVTVRGGEDATVTLQF